MCRTRPNIIYIMADDMGYGDPGCYGATKIPTPHMDRLASQGTRFTDCHSASAVCTPSRYAVLTGRYCWRSRLKRWVLWGFEPPLIEPERLTVASLLQQQGYATAAVGKWHVGLGWTTSDSQDSLPDGVNVDYAVPVTGGPTALGFDTSFIITGSLDMAPYCFIQDDRVVGTPSVEKHPYNPQQRQGWMVPGWDDALVDTTFTQKAVDFIDSHHAAHPEQPFFLYLTPSAPHRPCMPPSFVKGASQAGARGDMVCMVDWMVGQIDGALERLDLTDDTLIIVTSDNGARLTCFDGQDYGHRSCGDWRGQKADIWEGGHREPFIARWPGRVPAGTTCAAPVCLVDLIATIADLVQVALPDGAVEDSYSMLPALLGNTSQASARPPLVHHSGAGIFSVRRGPWKLITGLGSGGFSEPRQQDPVPGGPRGQLYHMEEDPQETVNRWLDRPDTVAELTSVLDGVRAHER